MAVRRQLFGIVQASTSSGYAVLEGQLGGAAGWKRRVPWTLDAWDMAFPCSQRKFARGTQNHATNGAPDARRNTEQLQAL